MNTTNTITGAISSMEVCNDKQRRNDVRNSDEGSTNLSGLDYVEVSPDELTLTVTFPGKAPAGKVGIENILIDGGQRIRGIAATKVKVNREKDPELDDTMDVSVNKSGDYSTYTLYLVQPQGYDAQGNPTYGLFPGVDQRYGTVDFSFKAGYASDLDCAVVQVCLPTPVTEPEINYLAKDYASFRQLLLDRLAITMPGWQEQHIPDIGIVIVEILAYVADYLSYYQDAVATEAYLGTARQRISMRRHVRLVDYHIHEGCNARTWMFVSVNADLLNTKPGDVYFIAGADSANTSQLPPGSYEFFEPLVEDATQPLNFYAAHDEINFYTWGDSECCLPLGATSATLQDYIDATDGKDGNPGPVLQNLKVGDFLFFEEVLGAKTGVAEDTDPTHRHVVRLTSVQPMTDALYNKNVVEIAWATADALPFALCISAIGPAPDCLLIENISVAHGNILLVDHGQTINESLPDCVPIATTTAYCDECERQAADITVSAGPYNPSLKQTPLTFSQPLPGVQGAINRAPTAYNAQTPAVQLLQQDPRSALPNIVLKSQSPSPDIDLLATSDCPPPLDCTDFTNPQLSTWLPLYDLLESGGEDYSFVVEMDNDGVAHLRFGDNELGREPDPLEVFCARYRVGNGPAGNVGAEMITQMVVRNTTINDPGLMVRNPFAAMGGTLREPLQEIRLYAPGAFMFDQERAITADDYARLAGEFPGVQRAAASLRWTGVNYDARVAIQPDAINRSLRTDGAQPALLRAIERYLQPFRRIGHDVQVVQAEYVPIELVMNICVLPNYLAAHVKAALLAAFSNSIQPNGTRGFFYPDNLSFGGSIAVSTLAATAQAVTGVQSVVIDTLERYGEMSRMALRLGVLLIGPIEIAQLDNDPNEPEHGTLTFNMRGGR
ncbi:MAG: putative baseplate assembly protein [Ktedonobacteraceae bacterium]